jgi:outer membrane receptor for ferrienterochelin and colicins
MGTLRNLNVHLYQSCGDFRSLPCHDLAQQDPVPWPAALRTGRYADVIHCTEMTPYGKRHVAALVLLSLSRAACAQPATPPNSPSPPVTQEQGDATPVPRVEVKAASSSYDPRRDDTASKTVITQEELLKYGDTNVFDVLKRAPGVTVTGSTIRMRGLGAGYTQILVNGERAPPGFSLDNLAPDQIERIEIVRAASAEFSMQAIAGTVNIVLKRTVARPQRDLRLNAGGGKGAQNGTVSGTFADRSGNLSYALTGTVARNLTETASGGGDRFTAPGGAITQARTSRGDQRNRGTSVNMQPRVSWKLPDDGQFNVSGVFQRARSANDAGTALTNSIGNFGTPDYVGRTSASDFAFRFNRAEANWITKVGGGKLDAKISLNTGVFDNDLAANYRTADRATILDRLLGSHTEFTTYSSSGKYARALSASNSLAMGWEVTDGESDDQALRIDRLTAAPLLRVDEHFRSGILQLAAFAQDEWNITPLWSMYLGARWESIRMQSSGTGLDATSSTNAVLTPVAQTLYKFPDKSGRQVRVALTRTFKAPDVQQFRGRRFVAAYNTRFTPDTSGNPRLEPELATGIDAAYEHFWAPGALFSVSGAVRHIAGYIRSTLTQEPTGIWLSQPNNSGDVQVQTLEMELKFPLKQMWKTAPPIDVRASLNRNWSDVDTVPGPDNRLDEQVPFSAVAGFDYRQNKITAGASLSFKSGGPLRVSEQQSAHLYRRRDLDAYVAYKFTPQYQLRVAASNLFGQDSRTYGRYQDAAGASETWSVAYGEPRVQVSLELKL